MWRSWRSWISEIDEEGVGVQVGGSAPVSFVVLFMLFQLCLGALVIQYQNKLMIQMGIQNDIIKSRCGHLFLTLNKIALYLKLE